MKVLLDISLLLEAFYSGRGFTRLHRATDVLYRELAGLPDLDLRFCAIQSPLADAWLADAWTHLPYVAQERVVRSFTYRGIPRRILERHIAPRMRPRSEAWVPRTVARQFRSLVKRLAVPLPVTEPVDVYHSPFPPLPARDRCRAAARVLTVHDIIPVRVPQWVEKSDIRTIEQVVASIGPDDTIIAPSAYTRDDLCAYATIDPVRVTVIPWAADRNVFKPVEDPGALAALRRRYGIPDGPYVLSLSTLEPRKNFAHLIRAFEDLLAAGSVPDASLVLAGSKGWMYDEIFSSARGARCRERVVFAGRVPDADLAALYSGARAFVFVSLVEGFGLPVLEAMQCGTPVIASNTTSIPEVTGDAAWLLDPTDRPALVQAMETVLRDDAVAARLSAGGVARAAGFSWSRCAAETVRAFEAAVADPART